MSQKISMMFSQNSGNSGNAGKVVMRVSPSPVSAPLKAPAPAQQQPRVLDVNRGGLMATSRSAPRGIKQLFNLGHIMANPGTPCKACGS